MSVYIYLFILDEMHDSILSIYRDLLANIKPYFSDIVKITIYTIRCPYYLRA